MVVARSGRNYLPSLTTERAALESIVLKMMVTKYWISVSVDKRRKRELVLKLGHHPWMRDRFKQCFQTLVVRKTSFERCVFVPFENDALLSRRRRVSESELLREEGQIETTREAFQKKIEDQSENDMSWWKICEDMDRLKASEMSANAD